MWEIELVGLFLFMKMGNDLKIILVNVIAAIFKLLINKKKLTKKIKTFAHVMTSWNIAFYAY